MGGRIVDTGTCVGVEVRMCTGVEERRNGLAAVCGGRVLQIDAVRV